jgi:propionyl-CoA synthetase
LSYNCLDRNLELNSTEWALVYDSEATDSSGFYTYKQLHRKVIKFAGVLKNLGIKSGDKVILYMPDIPLAAMANLALWRIGGISVPIHCSFGEKSLITAIDDLNPALIITASCYVEGEKVKYLK